MIDLPERSSRPPPSVKTFKKKDGTIDHERFAEEQTTHLRKEIDQLWAAIRELQRASPGDRADFVRVVSDGHGATVAVPHGMSSAPDSYDVASQNGEGSLVPARDKLADGERAYFKCFAVEGVAFRVRLYRSADGMTEDAVIDDPVLEDE